MNQIVINNLNYNYYNGIQRTRIKALQNVTLCFERGMRILVCGKNGAGKSTLLSIIAGKKLIMENEVLIFKKQAFHDTDISNKIGYVGEWWSEEYAMNISIKDFCFNYGYTKRYKNLLKLFELDENKIISSLSKGERKKVQIMVNIIVRKDIYIFDEATESLDLVSRKLLLEFLKKECIKYNSIVIYSTHIFDHMDKWSTHVLYLSEGIVTFFSSIYNITSLENYSSLAEHICDHMVEEIKKKEKVDKLDDLLLIDSD
ncbi:CCR4-associated factor 16, putative [Plasmodium sp. DRC-Itaito]|uniref:CCR4-associated factor 16, putative n=1 Tax=Plasmodium gaboni TaxID=647221 RepID=A0ABY1UTU9_9APIC|nr:CCR4-associated factor 16, putative [Plasmodium gaboni]SOV25063.1 CCR4-associated factor 16, putative [Plasmodium sp. DRC-Itaito]